MTVDIRPPSPGIPPPSACVCAVREQPRLPGAVQPRPPSDSRSELSRWMGTGEANLAGNVHGGVIMYLCDEVAGIAAVRHCGTRVVTVAMDRMTFINPVYVGHLVTVKATVNAAWRSSMEVGVRVEAENVRTGEVTHTSTAYLTMVSLTDEGKPAQVPSLEPQNDAERRRQREAELRRTTRLREREEILAARNGSSE